MKLGSEKGVILAAQNEPKPGVPSIVYLHAGLEIGSAIPYAIHRGSVMRQYIFVDLLKVPEERQRSRARAHNITEKHGE